MAMFKAHHYYVLKYKKRKYLKELYFLNDTLCSDSMVELYEDKTGEKLPIINDEPEYRNVLQDILDSTGAPL